MSGKISSERLKKIVGIVLIPLACLLTWVVVGDRARASSRLVHVINAGPAKRTVKVGEHELSLGPGEVGELVLAEGPHQATLEPGGETLSFSIEGDFLERYLERTAFVLNLDGAALLAFEVEEYGPVPAQQERPRERLFFGEPFVTVRGVDFVFDEFPQQVEGQGLTLIKTRLAAVPGPPGQAITRFAPDDPAALDYAELHLDPARLDEALLNAYLRRSRALKQLPGALRFLEARLEPVSIPWHRMVQDLLTATGEDPARLRARYDERLAAEPGDAAALYLRGRMAEGPAEKRAFYEKAVAADGENAWARYALAVHAARRGDHAGARPHALKAAALRPNDQAMHELAFRVRFALGEHEALLAETEARLAEAPVDLLALRRRLEALVALGRKEEATEAVQSYRQEVKGRLPHDPAQLALHAELLLLDLLGEHAKRAELAATLTNPRQRAWIVFQARLESGDLPAAEEALSEVGQPAAVLFLAVARQRAGADVAAYRERCAQALPMAAELVATPDLEGLLALQLPDTTKAALLELLGSGKPDFDAARKRLAATTLYFPRRLLD